MSDLPEKPGDLKPVNQLMNNTRQTYQGFQDLVRFREGDSLWVLGYKLALRFFGVLLMIILSPFLVIGLLIAFLAVL
jgi:hypothetical protein